MYRKLLDNPIASDLEFIGLFTWLLLKANHESKTFYFNKQKTTVERGEFITSMQEIAKHFKISRSKAYRLISILESEHILKHEGNTKYTVIKIHNYAKYQSSETQNETQTIQQTEHARYTNKNDKNDKKLITKVIKGPDPEVEAILKAYKEKMGFNPTDKYPRRVAHNLRQHIHTLLKDLSQDRPDLTFQQIVDKTFTWYDKNYEYKGDTLDVVKRKASILFDSTRKKYLKEVITK